MARFERHVDTWQSDRLRDLYAEVSGYPVTEPGDGPAGPASSLALPMRLRQGDVELSLISAVSTFNTPLDVTESELAIETFLPVDPQTAKALSAM